MKAELFCIFLIIVSGAAVYANSINGPFVWDDIHLIQENPHIKSWPASFDIFLKGSRGVTGAKSYFYRPLQMLTFTADHSLWKLDPRGYHVTNLILHIGAALCIFWLISLLYKDVLLSFLAGILFALHPIHTEAVSYISGRADPLAAVFLLLCFILYVKYIDSGTLIRDIVISALYALALLSRESSLILPFLLLLYHYAFSKKIIPGRLLPVFGITVAYIPARLFLLRGLLPHCDCPNTLVQRLPGFFVAMTNYVRLLLLPLGLHMEYGNKLFSFSNPQAILGVFIFVLLVFLMFRMRRTGAIFTFSLGWFLISLLPMSNLYPINAYMAEHWLYLPSIGFFLILAKALMSLRQSQKPVFAVLLISFSFLTIRQNSYWRDPEKLYERTIRYAPGSSSSYNNLGIIYGDMGQFEKAAALFAKAIETDPSNSGAYNNLGKAYRALGRNGEALKYYEKAVEIAPGSTMSYYNLGNAYRDSGMPDKAIASFNKAIEIDAHFAKVHYNLGNLYYKMGRLREAIASYENAVKADPGFAHAYSNLAVVYYDTKQYALALKCLAKSEALGAKNDTLAERLKAFKDK